MKSSIIYFCSQKNIFYKKLDFALDLCYNISEEWIFVCGQVSLFQEYAGLVYRLCPSLPSYRTGFESQNLLHYESCLNT